MASAVLASQNESSSGHMGKISYTNSHLNSNSNPNPNPKKRQKKFHHAAAKTGVVRGGRHLSSNNAGSPVVTQTASDDAYSFNQASTSRAVLSSSIPVGNYPLPPSSIPVGNYPLPCSSIPVGNYGSYISYNLSSCSKSELVELRDRLSSELYQIQYLRERIESGQFGNSGNPRSQVKPKKISGNIDKQGVVGFGAGSMKQLNWFANGSLEAVNYEGHLKECGKLLTKLLKNKYAYVFKVPVDAVGMGLHDYHIIVKRPMDLGTVKANLGKNLYSTPQEFAADVRLTFNNALLYNPKTDPVSGMAEQMLDRFEEMFRPIQEKIDAAVNQQRETEKVSREFRPNGNEMPYEGGEGLQGSSWNNHIANPMRASPSRVKKAKPGMSPVPAAQSLKKSPEPMQQMPMHAHSSASTHSRPPPSPVNQQQLVKEQFPPSPVRAPPMPPVKQPKVVGRTPGAVKQPKPRAKDLNKREMSMEEKHKLGLGLQSLPQEKMPQLVQIIRKRNEHLAQDGDEIELDIEALDTETLWELDRFVTNWKKFVSKTKRQALLVNTNPSSGVAAPSTPTTEADTEFSQLGATSDKYDDSLKKVKDIDDDDVDIDDDDDMPATSFPPIEIEKDEGAGGGGGVGQDHDRDRVDNGNASSSSSSSGSSSSDSSSDSDSGSSSGSDSDADEAQS